MSEQFQKSVDEFRNTSKEQTAKLAFIYGAIMSDIAPGVEKARYAASQLGDGAIRGSKELTQLIQIMDGGFVRVAQQIIEEAQKEAAPAVEESVSE